MTGTNDGFALVELFTSEGCSSCPPADELIEEVQEKYSGKNVIALSYHVDYWDRLGWKDPFSSADFTNRQEYYGGIFRLNSIYTPQAVINGETEFVGSNSAKLISSIEERLKTGSPIEIKLNVLLKTPGKVEVIYSTGGSSSKQERLFIALVQKAATNKIKRGENEGRTLHHINIVRDFSSVLVSSQEETATFNLPPGMIREDFFVAAFVQNKTTGKITGLTKMAVK